ncbi:hypothetical protein ACQP1K_13780 [Sphaerimonospora sp. CA-214678]|uniref:hypothetical protein n=1 Tax=Sphaerimonospora sp. CA-214678 TaxID=3240029 RepID=UPI003D8C0107
MGLLLAGQDFAGELGEGGAVFGQRLAAGVGGPVDPAHSSSDGAYPGSGDDVVVHRKRTKR